MSLWNQGQAELSFAFRTLIVNSTVLVQLNLNNQNKQSSSLFLRIKLVSDQTIVFDYPHLGSMTSKEITSRVKLNKGNWHLIQLMANQYQVRLSIGSDYRIFSFDSLRFVNTSLSSVYIGGAPNRQVHFKYSLIKFN